MPIKLTRIFATVLPISPGHNHKVFRINNTANAMIILKEVSSFILFFKLFKPFFKGNIIFTFITC